MKRRLRSRFGLWPIHEARNRVVFAPKVRALRAFETAEVERLRRTIGRLPEAEVATVIPTFRRPALLVAAVESALSQQHRDHHIIVVDDGGGLPAAMPTDDRRLTVVSLSRNSQVLGLVRNVGIRLTRSRYIAFLDDDNLWYPNHLSLAIGALRSGNGLIYTAVERRLTGGDVLDTLSTPFERRTFVDASSYVDANSVVIRRRADALFSRIPRVKATLPKEDWEFVYRMSKRLVVAHVPITTVSYLVNEESYYTEW